MIRSVDEANSEIGRIRQMPYGIARSTAASSIVQQIQSHGPDGARAYALFTAVEAYVMGDEVAKAFLPFTQMLAWWDEHPEHFDSMDQHSLFWSFKWMVSHLMDFPSISADQIEATLTDMHRRYALAGNGMNAVAHGRFQWAAMRGTADVESLYDQWTTTPRDDFSQCEACDPGDRAAHLFETKRYAECVRMVESGLPESATCLSEPGDIYSYVQLAYLYLGDAAGAARAHRAAVHHLPQSIPAATTRGRHLEFLARAGHPTRALDSIRRDHHLLTSCDTPYEQWIYLRHVVVAITLCGPKSAHEPFTSPGVPATTMAELHEWARRGALDLAAQFDERNGTDAVTRSTHAAWSDQTTLDVDLSILSAPAAPTPEPAGDTPRNSGAPIPPTPASDVDPDPATQARWYIDQADHHGAAGRLQDAGFAYAEAAVLADTAQDWQTAEELFVQSITLLRGADTPVRYQGPIVRAWARRARAQNLDAIVAHVDTLIDELASVTLPEHMSPDLAQREQALIDTESRHLRDTRARLAGARGEPDAAALLERAAEEYARAGDYSDAAHSFWLLGRMSRENETSAVFFLESAIEGFAKAHDRAHRQEAGNELVELLTRLDRHEEAQELARILSETR